MEPIGSPSASLYDPGEGQERSEGKGKHDLCRIMPLWREAEPATNKAQERPSNVQYGREARTRGFKLRMTQILILALGGLGHVT